MSDPTLALTEALIALPSITPQDGGCLELIAARLTPLGFRCERLDRGKVSNLWARRGNSGTVVCLAGHTDVVPPGPLDMWHSDPFVPTRRDGKLFGRGAADMKGSLAAFVTAVENFVAAHPDHHGSIALLLTSDEEGDAVDGTVAVVDALRARAESIDYCLVGEPTSVDRLGDTIKNGRRGSLSGRLLVHGVQGHIAYPHLAKNPIHLVAPAIAELSATRWDDGGDHFPPTTWQISNIHGGTGATNVIPGQVEIQFNFRFSTASTADSLKQRFIRLLSRQGLEFTIDWTLGAVPFLTVPGVLTAALTTAIEEITGITPQLSTSGGTSDGRFLSRICAQVVELGPVNASIHKIDECVALEALPQLSRIYQRTLEELLLK